MGIVGNLNLSAMFTCAETLPKRSDPLTPHVNCFHSVSERQGWGVVLFFFFLKIHHQECNCSYSLSVHLFPWDSKHTDPQTRSSQSEEQLPLSCFRPQISEPDMTRRSFSSAEPVCYVAAGVPRDFCWVHFLCLLRQHSSFHLWRRWNKHAIQSLAAWLLCSPEKYVWKIQNLSSVQGIYDQVRIIHPS